MSTDGAAQADAQAAQIDVESAAFPIRARAEVDWIRSGIRIRAISDPKAQELVGGAALLHDEFGIAPARLAQLAADPDSMVVVATHQDRLAGVYTGEMINLANPLHPRYVRSLEALAPELMERRIFLRNRAFVDPTFRGLGLAKDLAQSVLDWGFDEKGATLQIGATVPNDLHDPARWNELRFGAVHRVVQKEPARWLGAVDNFWYSEDPDLVPLLECPNCGGNVCSETAFVYVNGPDIEPVAEFPRFDLWTGEMKGRVRVEDFLK